MAGKDRKKELARLRYERQQQRRAARLARKRKIKLIVSISLALILVTAGGAAMTVGLPDLSPGAEKTEPAAASSSTPTPKPRVSVKPGECAYQPLDFDQAPAEAREQLRAATKDVGTPDKKPDRDGDYTKTIKTNLGDIVIKLDAAKAPCTVNSFRFLADKDFFDNTRCHRLVTKGIHVLQCGDPSGTGMGGPAYRFANENLPKPDKKNPEKPVTYPKGTVAMANSGGNESNGSQFFLVYDETELRPQYTRFGTVVEGMDIIEEVAKEGATSDDPQAGSGPPKKTVIIEDVTISK